LVSAADPQLSKEANAMDVPGSSSCIATSQESVPLGEDPFPRPSCGQ